MAPISAAVSARSSRSGLRTCGRALVCDGDRRCHDEGQDVAGLEQVAADVERQVDRDREGAEQLLRSHERQDREQVQHL